MIKVYIYRNQNGNIYGFKAMQHGDPVVCSAVSILTFNTVNSIEKFTKQSCVCELEESGFLFCELPDIKDGDYDKDSDLLFNSMLLGLEGIQEQYKKHLKIID